MDKIRVVLPKRYNLVVGDTFQLFYRGVVDAPNPYCYDILSVCEKGKNFPRYFEFTPKEEGDYKLTIYVYDANKVLIGCGETILKVVKANAPEKTYNILCLGDSLTSGGQWVAEAYRRLTAADGMPVGHGYSNINFIGSCEKYGVKYEGYGGWKWSNYASNTFDGVWVVSKGHIRTDKDQHSIWKDEDGELWQLETISEDMIKFMRHGTHRNVMKKGTYLEHISYAENTESIFVEDYVNETESPFLDKSANKIDIRKYCQDRKISHIDAVYVLLGINGLHAAKGTLKEFCNNIVNDAKELVKHIHSAYSEAKVIVSGFIVPSVTGGMGTNYGAVLPYCDTYGMARFVFDLNIAYEKWTNEEEYKDFMEFINLSGQFDTDYNMPSEEKNVNVRNKATEKIGINGVHPGDEGYMQIADAMYRHMVYLIKSN